MNVMMVSFAILSGLSIGILFEQEWELARRDLSAMCLSYDVGRNFIMFGLMLVVYANILSPKFLILGVLGFVCHVQGSWK